MLNPPLPANLTSGRHKIGHLSKGFLQVKATLKIVDGIMTDFLDFLNKYYNKKDSGNQLVRSTILIR